MKVILIAAMSLNRVIGQNGHLVYNDPEDMDFFKKTTVGNIVVMGRKTWDSIPNTFKPLKDRLNIVISRNSRLDVPDSVKVFDSWQSAKDWLLINHGESQVFVMGGGEIYKEAIKDADTLLISQFKTELPVNDKTTLFPEFKDNFNLIVQTYPKSKNFIINRYYVK